MYNLGHLKKDILPAGTFSILSYLWTICDWIAFEFTCYSSKINKTILKLATSIRINLFCYEINNSFSLVTIEYVPWTNQYWAMMVKFLAQGNKKGLDGLIIKYLPLFIWFSECFPSNQLLNSQYQINRGHYLRKQVLVCVQQK